MAEGSGSNIGLDGVDLMNASNGGKIPPADGFTDGDSDTENLIA